MKCWVDLEVFGVGFFRGGAGDKSYERLVDSSVGVGGFGFDFVTIILNWSRRVYRPLRNGLGFYRFFLILSCRCFGADFTCKCGAEFC